MHKVHCETQFVSNPVLDQQKCDTLLVSEFSSLVRCIIFAINVQNCSSYVR